MKKIFKSSKKIILALGAILVLFLGWYSYRLISADLLIDWHDVNCAIGNCPSKYYVVNSKNNSQTYIPSFLVSLVEINSKNTPEEKDVMSEAYKRLDSKFTYSISILGLLDKKTVVFTENGSEIYKYNVETDQHEILFKDDNLINCIAGKERIFYTVGNKKPSFGSDQEYLIIYEYVPNGNKKIEIGKYKTPNKTFSLDTILK